MFTEAERAFNLVLARALEAEGHRVYLPQRDTPSSSHEVGRTAMVFHANPVALRNAEAVVAVCDGSQVNDGTAWEIGYAYGQNIQIFGLRTDVRIVQRARLVLLAAGHVEPRTSLERAGTRLVFQQVTGFLCAFIVRSR